MSGTHVRVRLVTAGMVASDLLLDRPHARMTCIEVGRRQTPLGLVVDHFALTEGLTQQDISTLVSAWEAAYGLRAATVGAPFALRLPLPLARVPVPGVARLHEVPMPAGAVAGHVLQGGLCDFWVDCQDPEHAERLAHAVRGLLPATLGATVAVGDPSVADRECWAALRLAEDVARVAS